MPLIIPNEGAPTLLKFTLGLAAPSSITWGVALYTNNPTLGPGTIYAYLTQASGTGMNSQTVSPSAWGAPTIISNRASSTYGSPTPFNFTNGTGSAITAYGYLVFDATNSLILFCETFASSRTLNPGDELQLTLNFTGGTQT